MKTVTVTECRECIHHRENSVGMYCRRSPYDMRVEPDGYCDKGEPEPEQQ